MFRRGRETRAEHAFFFHLPMRATPEAAQNSPDCGKLIAESSLLTAYLQLTVKS